MAGGILILLTIISTVAGWILNKNFKEIYSIDAIHVCGFVFQTIGVFCILLTIEHISIWLILAVAFTTVSYIYALQACKMQAISINASDEDINKAMLAQAILPFGVAVILLLLIAWIMGAFSGKKKANKK